MKHHIIDNLLTNKTYTGKEIESHWAKKHFNITGNNICSWIGPANVTIQNMKDLDDIKDNKFIYSESMLHFIAEFFLLPPISIVMLQRLFIQQIYIYLLKKVKKNIILDGNDIFLDNKKMSVSIACSGIISHKFHFGINVTSDNTPIPTIGLKDIFLNPENIRSVADDFCSIFEDMHYDIMKAKTL